MVTTITTWKITHFNKWSVFRSVRASLLR